MEEFSHKIEEQEQTIAQLEKSNSSYQLKIGNLQALQEELKEKVTILELELSTAHEEIISIQDQSASQLSALQKSLQENFDNQLQKVQEELSEAKYKQLEQSQLHSR